MGAVYKAKDLSLGRTVAIKVLPPDMTAIPERKERFIHEAKAASSLQHPNIITIFEVGKQDGLDFLVMEFVEGMTLEERIPAGGMKAGEALPIALQMADGLVAAHESKIIHRDLKPSNVMVTREGLVKILDFGLAKLVQPFSILEDGSTVPNALTADGAILGTVAYMSPEQAEGRSLDARSDIFTFGAVLYEMLTGRRAFEKDTVSGTIAAVMRDEVDMSEVSRNLSGLVSHCLQKNVARRFQTMAEVRAALGKLEGTGHKSSRRFKNSTLAAASLVLALAAAAAWFGRQYSREQWALQTAIPEIARLSDAGENGKAAELTRQALRVLPNDPTLEKAWIRSTGEVSIASTPSDADVAIRPYRGDSDGWSSLGPTPLRKVRVPREAFVWRLRKPGFADLCWIASPPGVPPPGYHYNFDLKFKLHPAGSVPPEMAVIPGGTARLTTPLAEAPPAAIEDFLIDRHEVTNQEYKKFVDAGGYRNRTFWKQPFQKDGRTLPWEEAAALFRDATGHPGPSTWEVGDYPRGQEKHPVAGVSWFEAAAYAEFAGKSLPTAYHWTGASQSNAYTPLIVGGSNFRHQGTRPCGEEGTLSGFGTTDMAGNVKEWCLNESRNGKRVILGGGFGEPEYMFHISDEQSPWDRLPNFGFRCVKLDAPPAGAAAARIEVTDIDYRKEKPVPEDVLKAYTAMYAYDKGELHAGWRKPLRPTAGHGRR